MDLSKLDKVLITVYGVLFLASVIQIIAYLHRDFGW